MNQEEHMRYLAVLGILTECSAQVNEETREMILQAFEDACQANPNLQWRRIMNRVEIEVRSV